MNFFTISNREYIFKMVFSPLYTPVNKHSNGKWTLNEDVFPIEHGDIPASCVGLPEGNVSFFFLGCNSANLSKPPLCDRFGGLFGAFFSDLE